MATLAGHTGPVFAVKCLREGRVVSGADDTKLKIWNSRLMA